MTSISTTGAPLDAMTYNDLKHVMDAFSDVLSHKVSDEDQRIAEMLMAGGVLLVSVSDFEQIKSKTYESKVGITVYKNYMLKPGQVVAIGEKEMLFDIKKSNAEFIVI